MTRMRSALFGVLAAALLTTSADADKSANYMVPACRSWLTEIEKPATWPPDFHAYHTKTRLSREVFAGARS
jgi:hypothetical protein